MSDSGRVKAYASALQQVVTPESCVLDLGAGTGAFSLLACSYGARKVYAVEPNEAIAVAKELAEENRFSERMECINLPINDFVLDEPVDIIVSDLRGVLPLYGTHIPTIVYAREKYLKPNGVLLPCADTLWAAVADTAEARDADIDGNFEALSFTSLHKHLRNNWSRKSIGSTTLLSEAKKWVTLDYATVTEPHVSQTLSIEITKAGNADGFFLWFDAEILPGIGYSGGPRDEVTSYGCVYFPFSELARVEVGYIAEIDLQARLINGEYIWVWNTSIRKSKEGPTIARFSQSSFYGDAFTKEGLGRTLASNS